MTRAFHATTDVVAVSRLDIEHDWLNACQREPDKKFRFCAHKSISDPIHEMLIIHTKDTIVPIHRHHLKSESFHWIYGAADVVLYNDDGTTRETIHMGTYESNRNFYYRLNADIYHTLKILTPVVVFHETTPGPWTREDLIVAPFWIAPAGWAR